MADMERNREFDVLRIFGDILEDFLEIFEEFWRNWFIVRRLKNLHKITHATVFA